MIKKFFGAIILAFAFLFLNVSIDVKAADLPEEIMANAGIGEKKGYWAIVNYGADYIGDNQVTIDIQQEALADTSVNSIAIVESEYVQNGIVHYERNKHPEFASKIIYNLRNLNYGEKYITILLLTEFSNNPEESLIVDKITVRVIQKRKISELNENDILIIKENEEVGASPYKVNVTLPEQVVGKGKLEDYVFDEVTYTFQRGDKVTTLNALYESLNNFYFTVSQNGTYLIKITDIFGCEVTKTIVIDNLRDPEIIIEAMPQITTFTNADFYMIDVIVMFYESGDILTSSQLSVLEYSLNNGARTSIIENMQIKVAENGIYSIYARSSNGSEATLDIQINNFDREVPFVQVLDQIIVYTETVNLFDPSKEIFVFDNISTVATISITQTYYEAEEGVGIVKLLTTDYRAYLFSVRDIIVRYKVEDEAGNFIEVDTYVKSVDNTKPVIDTTIVRKDFYINDSFEDYEAIKAYIEEAYGLLVTDNSIYENTKWSIDYSLDFSMLPLDQNNRLNMLGLYYIYASAVDEAGNISEPISLVAEVRQRLIRVEADLNQYIVYGDLTIEEIADIELTYHCVTRFDEIVDCRQELLEGDSITGELYILNAYYAGLYEIYYDNIRVPSKLYYLEYGDQTFFEVKERTMKVIAHDKEKFYLDDDPGLTWEVDNRVCDENNVEYYNKDYRCTFAPNTGDEIIGNLERYMGEPPEGIDVWMDEYSWSVSEAVWYDSDGRLVARAISQGSLSVYERYNGGTKPNYIIDFDSADFLIKPKHIDVYVKGLSKIYGEADPDYEIAECRGAYPIDGADIDYCIGELRVLLERKVSGETVVADADGNYIDYYLISGVAGNANYEVVFHDAYLTIIRRDISISVVGDRDAEGNPTGKYTIYYENTIPMIEVYDSSVGAHTGLVNNPTLGIIDKFSSAEAELYTEDGELVVGYVNGIGIYIIKKGNIKILNKDDEDAEYNYNVTFNDGKLEVIKKDIWIKIIKDLTKLYGDPDKIFTDEDLEGYSDYIILEANGRFIIEITPTTLEGEEPYIPRDNEKMKYHLKRAEGIYVGLYPVSIEKLEGCENYDVFMYSNYNYEIQKRDLTVAIDNQTIIYRETPKPFTYTEGKLIDGVWVKSLQYNDELDGDPELGEFRHVGTYQLGAGTIKVVDPEGNDVTFNYNMDITGGILKIVQREVVIDVAANQKKQYGEDDPEMKFTVYYNGVEEIMPEDDYKGRLGREKGEVPDRYYEINWGTFEILLNGLNDDGLPVGNYLVKEFNNNHKFYIEKRTIVVSARNVTAIYGNDYSESIRSDTNGGLAYNLTLSIDGAYIHDHLVGELKILGEVDGVGTYTISCEDIRILRYYTGEDVTYKYYNYTFENGTLEILPRTIKIKPVDGQFKTYGDSDIGIKFTYSPELLDVGDKFVGTLQRNARNVNGVDVTEDVGQYTIGLGTLAIQTPSGKENYTLVLDGTATFTINYRTLILKANDLEIFYGDPYEFTYSIIEGSLANNPDLGIVDTIEGELTLDREYTGYGTYNIVGDNLVLENKHNYNYNFLPGIFIVNKKLLIVTPSEETLYKVYGEEDPEEFKFDINVPGATYTGRLSRVGGSDVGKYRILMGTLNFGPNYDVILNEAYFTIMARVIEVAAQNTEKLYGTADPVLVYNYVGTLVGNDKFYGSLIRDYGEEVGEYEIMQGSLSLSSNYQIIYTPGIFTIKYAEFSSLKIHSLTSNQYQIKGEEEEVKLYVRFNEGADERDIGSVEWKIIKNEEMNWEFSKDLVNNVISFFPSGSIGTYVVSATYKGITDYYEVYVELSTIGNVYIRLVNGETNQTLGLESRLTYMVIVPENAGSDATVQWIINDTTVQANKVSNIYFDYTPNLGKGEYKVQAKIGGRISEPLYFYVKNNNPPVITLNGNAVVYIEARTGTEYIEQGAVVMDDIDGDITSSLVISGYVDEDVKGTYYIKYDAKDSHGNNAISVYRQVVVRDTTPPVVTLNGNREIKLLYGQPYIEYYATAVDNYDGEVQVSINNPVITNKIGTYEVTYIAYDNSGNRGTAVRYVQVIDNISPVISLIGNEIMYVEVYTKFEDPGALVVDNVDGTFVMPASSFFFGDTVVEEIDTSVLGTYYVHYDYQDTAGNIGAGKVRIVIVRDSTPPVITLLGENPFIVRYSYPNINFEDPGAIAKDNYDEYVEVTRTGTLGNELGSYFLYYNAVDAHGNIAEEVVREVVIIDIENPIIHFFERCPQYITIEALYEEYDTRCDAPNYGIWVEDDYMADLEELQKRVVVTGSVDNTKVGLYIIKYDVKDMSGNAAVTLNRYVEVVDTTAPVISLKCDDGKECSGDTSQIVEVFTPYIELGAIIKDRYDNYHGIEITPIISHNVNITKLGEYIVTYNAVDSNGNRANPVIRKVYVKDTTPPEITIIGENPMTIERGLGYIEYEVTVIDNYDGPIPFDRVTIVNQPSGMNYGKYEVIYKVSDSSGNVGQAIRVVNVVDTIPPIVLGVEDGKYYKEPVSIYFIPTLGTDETLRGWLNGEEITSPYYLEAEGEYDLVVEDDAGNKTEIWFAIDRTPPLILGVRNGEYTNREVVDIYSNEKLKYYEYRYQNGGWVRSEEQTLSFTAEGTYRIYAVDMADNVSTVVMFVIDRTAPNYNLTGVLNKGITNTDVSLITEENAIVAVNASYNIPTLYTFTDQGYYQVVIRDLAGNTVTLQFVINRSNTVVVNQKTIGIISQHNAIGKVSISGKSYARDNGLMIAMPLLEGGFKYVSGKLFSESEYQTLLSGGVVEITVSETDDTYMFVGFVVSSDELNKFGSQTVDGDGDDDSAIGYGAAAFFALLLILLLFIFFLKRRRKQEEEEETEEETIYEDY